MRQIQLTKPGGLENLLICEAEMPTPKPDDCLLYTSPSPRD